MVADRDKRLRWPSKRIHTPTVIQMESVECGAAALGIVLGYYGRWVPLEKLRAECGVSRDGSKAINMLKVARYHGLEAHGYKKSPDDVAQMELPVIVFWNFNHFLVVEGFSKKWVHLNDPASGPRRVTHEEFDQSFTGVVLAFKKTPEFQPGGEKRSIVHSLRKRLVGSEMGLFYVILASLFLVVPGLVIPTFIKVFVDDILTKQQYHWILYLLLAILVTALVSGLVHWLQGYFLLRLQTKLALVWTNEFLWHVLWLPMEFYAQRYAGEVGSRVGINDKVASLLSGQLATSIMNSMVIFFYAIVMFFYDALLTWMAIGMAVVSVTALTIVSRMRTDANSKLLQDEGRLIGTTMGGLQMMETLKATGRESDFFARWAGYQAKVINTRQSLGRSNQAISLLPGVVASLGNMAILCVGGLRVIEGEMTVGMLMAFQSLMGMFLAPVNQLVNMGGRLQEAVGDLNRLDDVLMNPSDKPARAEVRVGPRLTGKLELRNVTFGYSPLEEPLIKDFNLVVEAGQRVALVGTTGSGKSTTSKLVCGLYKPWSGQVLFDDKPREELPRPVLTSSIAQVDQDIMMFAGTVRDNLTLWDDTVSDAELVRAAKDAYIHDAIVARPGGLDGVVEEGGQNFSGGERQRLEIARALVGNPSVLVLDEATSSLDPLVEKQIDEGIRARGCTCLIVAHRLSTIRDADEIIVLDKGKVVQRGRHGEMIAVDGHYRNLIQAEPGVMS